MEANEVDTSASKDSSAETKLMIKDETLFALMDTYNLMQLYALALSIRQCLRQPFEFFDKLTVACVQEVSSNQEKPKLADAGAATDSLGESSGATKLVQKKPENKLVELALVALSAKFVTLKRCLDTLSNDANVILHAQRVLDERVRRLNGQLETVTAYYHRLARIGELHNASVFDLRDAANSCSRLATDGTFVWSLTNVSQRRTLAGPAACTAVFSPVFSVAKFGYRLRLRVHLNGDGPAKANHMSVFLQIVKGPYDAVLQWPFEHKTTVILLDQNAKQHILATFKLEPHKSQCFRRPVSDANAPFGELFFAPLFILDDYKKRPSGPRYLANDTLYFKVLVDLANMKSLKWSPFLTIGYR